MACIASQVAKFGNDLPALCSIAEFRMLSELPSDFRVTNGHVFPWPNMDTLHSLHVCRSNSQGMSCCPVEHTCLSLPHDLPHENRGPPCHMAIAPLHQRTPMGLGAEWGRREQCICIVLEFLGKMNTWIHMAKALKRCATSDAKHDIVEIA